MSSDESRTTSSSRLSQFGLYRTIDARTEEFLRLSRKRQIRQGCACAAVSTAITVTVVVVILLIYEYAIAVESSLVQRIRWFKYSNNTNETQDNPVADRLDRSYFGFDQDYFERMPLLVNAMQENSYVDPALENVPSKNRARLIITSISSPKPKRIIPKPTTPTSNYRYNSIRRTSPRPFIFEYRSPSPSPFSKTYGSRSWVESYRNTLRLKNLQQVIKYLEKTINAKFGDMYVMPTSTHVAFSGYVETGKETTLKPKEAPLDDLIAEGSNRAETFKSNHQSDPLFSFKPENPGDVNLLADGFFRFSPIRSIFKDSRIASSNVPMFRQIPNQRRRPCVGIKCNEHIMKISSPVEYKNMELPVPEKPKSFSVMLNLFPLQQDTFDYRKLDLLDKATTKIPINEIYLTSPRPMIQFRPKSTVPSKRIVSYKRPRNLGDKHVVKNGYNGVATEEPKMIVHVNFFPPVDIKAKDAFGSESFSSTTPATSTRYVTAIPVLTSTQVEDYHVGSSGIIPVEARLTPAPPPPISTFPTVTTMLPFFDSTTTIPTDTWTTRPPDIIKFSQEDAKVPDQYKRLFNIYDSNDNRNDGDEIFSTIPPEISRRTSKDNVDKDEEEYSDDVSSTLISKLKNEFDETTEAFTTEDYIDTTTEASTTVKTYVPQMNGHYRNVNLSYKTINRSEKPADNRKRRLEMSIKGYRTYVPQYVEIKRNNTRNSKQETDDQNMNETNSNSTKSNDF